MGSKLTKITVKSPYSIDADTLWSAAVFYPALANPVNSKAYYKGLPEREAKSGDSLDLRMRLFGWLPSTPWHVEVVERNDAEKTLKSEERGGPVKTWKHVLKVEENGPMQSRIVDEIVMDAGPLTPLMARWVKSIYGARRKHAIKLNND